MGGTGGTVPVIRLGRLLAAVAAGALLAVMVQGWISSFGHAETRPKPRAAAPPSDLSAPGVDLQVLSSK